MTRGRGALGTGCLADALRGSSLARFNGDDTRGVGGRVGLVGAGGDADRTTQRITVLDHLDAAERGGRGGARHAGEQHRLRGLQAPRVRLAQEDLEVV